MKASLLSLLLMASAAAAGASCSAPTSAADPPLAQERTIALPGVKGRIDHLAYDPTRRRLFVAALGNGTVEAVDLATGAVRGRIAGLNEPQGLAYLPARDELAVATGGDGTVRFYRAGDLQPVGVTAVGGDADNLRVQPESGRLIVGSDDLAVIDPIARTKIAAIPLPAHAEGFQVHADRVYVNLPDAGVIGVVDLTTRAVVARWPNGGRRFNYPLAFERESGEAAVVYRLPARLVTFDPATGRQRQALPTCADADDLFFDPPRKRLYVVCGGGRVDVFERAGGLLEPRGQVATAPGARTGLFVPGEGRLYVAAPARGGREAAVLVLLPR
jgi:DNA-binding beta-propeller fold protein YncE